MQVVNTRISSFEDVVRIVTLAERFDTKIELIGDNNLTVSAKSLIAVVAASRMQELLLVIHSGDHRIRDEFVRVCA